MADAQLIKKLLIKPGMSLSIVNAPTGYLEGLGPLPDGVRFADGPKGTLDFVQLFVRDRDEYGQLGPAALRAVKSDGILWICYPKKSSSVESNLDREAVWKLLEPAGLRPVAQVAIDEVWSGLRFRPASPSRRTGG
jgi:ribosomal protein L25 (general stress protein Ctc)